MKNFKKLVLALTLTGSALADDGAAKVATAPSTVNQEAVQEIKKDQRRADDNKQYGLPGDLKEIFQRELAYGLSGAISTGLGHAMIDPLKVIFNKAALAITNPIESFRAFRLAIFCLLNSSAATYDKIIFFEQHLNNLVNNLLIELANMNNKVTRLKQMVGVDASEDDQDQEILFAVNRVLTAFDYVKSYLKAIRPVYVNESWASSMTFIRPYSQNELQSIVYAIDQLIAHIDYVALKVLNIKNLDDLENKKDVIKQAMKSLTNSFGSLVILLDSSVALNPSRKGLLMTYEGKYNGSDASKSKSPALA